MRKSTALAAVVLVLLGVWAVRQDRSERTARRAAPSARGAATPTPPTIPVTPTTPATQSASTAPGPLRVVTYGDSVPAGSLCDCADFPTRVAERLGAALSRPVTSENLAVGGYDSADVLGQVSSRRAGAALSAADLVIVEIGANDFSESLASEPECGSPLPCDRDDLDALRANLGAIVHRIEAVPGPADRTIALLGYWNIFKDGAVARAKGGTYVASSDSMTRQVNAVVAGVAARTDALYVDVYGPFAAIDDPTDHLAADGDHPNSAGHELLANAVVRTVERLRVLEPGS
jgi:lysophospholipase L1-like esterase